MHVNSLHVLMMIKMSNIPNSFHIIVVDVIYIDCWSSDKKIMIISSCFCFPIFNLLQHFVTSLQYKTFSWQDLILIFLAMINRSNACIPKNLLNIILKKLVCFIQTSLRMSYSHKFQRQKYDCIINCICSKYSLFDVVYYWLCCLNISFLCNFYHRCLFKFTCTV